METDNIDEIKRLTEELTQASHKLAEAVYQKASQAGQGPGPGGDAGAEAGPPPSGDDDVVDADFEEVKGDKK